MAGEEKTEKPSEKKRRDARKDGNVFYSKDLVTVVLLISVFFAFKLLIPYTYGCIKSFILYIFSLIEQDRDLSIDMKLFSRFTLAFFLSTLPLLLVTIIASIISYGSQTKFNVSFKSLKPKLSKLNPLNGIKKMFSLKNIVEIIKSLIKIVLLFTILVKVVFACLAKAALMFDMSLENSAYLTGKFMYSLLLKVILAFTAIAIFDYMYQRWKYEKELMMTKQEVKDEYKQMEGNPEIKGRIKQLQREFASSRMMQQVPDADVVIKNPTHFAVALKYKPDKASAPYVIAKGKDELALRIISKAEENNVSVVKNIALARGLYKTCDINDEIPSDFYGEVAEILVFIFKSQNREDIFM